MTAATEPRAGDVRVERIAVSAYRIPTDRQPETDGTARWDATTIVVVEIAAGGEIGTGWTYGTAAVAAVVDGDLRGIVEGRDALATRALWTRMNAHVRNAGRSGIASYAVSAVDVALWDLRARLFGASLCDCLGITRDAVPVYGSGGFTSYDVRTLQQQLAGWAHDGMRAVKMKAGRDHAADPHRVAAAREAIGPDVQLFVDANGGYDVASAIAFAHGPLAEHGVTWFEQPVDHEDLDGTRRVRDHAPPGIAVSSGEYITDTAHAALVAGSVDVVQADATRCGGYTGFLAIDGYCDVTRKPLSTHCSPMLHLHVASAALRVRHMEWFHDHVRIERRLFDGFVEPVRGRLAPDRSRPGHGLTFKHADAKRLAL
ncbi:MAG TPA: enolase C-terminal domain-like protein [Candidatus Elarobacter sp.]|jgi:L-alanine-DL-glutamate epimerase-like enolase superfamily enzyme|nr:enolase C-terminal domain-like protein [Candidatus Elarobacter sp.]